jgi:hypothetical protein
MAAYVKYQQFVEDLAKKVHNLDSDALKIALTNAPPNVSTHKVLADITEIAAGNGYSAGGAAAAFVSGAQASGTFKLVLSNAVITAAGGSVGPFRYAVLYNSTPGSPLKPLIAYFDYGSSLTLNDGESFTVSFDATNGVLTLA